jgi:hypothetical protein
MADNESRTLVNSSYELCAASRAHLDLVAELIEGSREAIGSSKELLARSRSIDLTGLKHH